MATTAAAPQTRTRVAWRLIRWILLVLLALIAGLLVFAWFRPLTLLWFAAQMRLRLAGIHSEYTVISLPDTGRVHIHYYVGGSGSPIVLVHGLGGRAEDWAGLMPDLVRDHHRVYALDLPGYGRSDWPRQATYSIHEEAAAVEAFLENRHLSHTNLGGWSMGGWIAMKVALDEPQRIQRLMIFDSAGTRFSLTWDTSLFEPDTPKKLRELDDLLMAKPAPAVPGFIQRDVFHFVRRHGWVVRRNMESMLTGADLLDGQLGRLKMPMLIVWGKQDHIIPLSAGEEIHREVPQSEMEVFDGCGHLAPDRCASRISPVVTGFLDEATPIAGRKAVIP